MFKIYLGLLSAVFFWASAFVGIAICLQDFSPQTVGAGRGLVSSLIALILYLKYFKTRYPLVDRLQALGLGVLGIGVYGFFLNMGEKTVPAGVAGFIIGQMPLIASILAFIFFKEKIGLRLLIGTFVSLIGLFFIMLGTSVENSIGQGVFFIGISTLSAALYTCFQKPVIKRMSTIPFICHAIWGGSFFLIFLALLSKVSIINEIKQAPFLCNFSLVYLGIGPSVIAYIGWTYALARVNVAKAGILFYSIPVLGGLLAWFLLREIPTKVTLFGMLFASIGALIGTFNFKRKESPKSVPTN
jgi:drug/metabolite transporter (DMT)-like permease